MSFYLISYDIHTEDDSIYRDMDEVLKTLDEEERRVPLRKQRVLESLWIIESYKEPGDIWIHILNELQEYKGWEDIENNIEIIITPIEIDDLSCYPDDLLDL